MSFITPELPIPELVDFAEKFARMIQIHLEKGNLPRAERSLIAAGRELERIQAEIALRKDCNPQRILKLRLSELPDLRLVVVNHLERVGVVTVADFLLFESGGKSCRGLGAKSIGEVVAAIERLGVAYEKLSCFDGFRRLGVTAELG
jgi:hypothetical protein